MSAIRHHNALPAGYVLHWYQVESVLGQGGFGITYLATDTNLDQQVAIKEFLPAELAVRVEDSVVRPVSDDRSETFGWGLNRFLTEARTLAQFRHPNIVRVYSVFEANSTAYMVMEYEHGASLEDAFKFARVSGEHDLLCLLYPLLDGLKLVHEAGFIHRDIKPANIFLRDNGVPVLLDFGSARQALGVETRTLTSLVTPGYAPFEQYNATRDNDKQGPWTDIYSLAATLYRGILGKGPVDAVARADALLNGESDPFVRARDAAPAGYSTRLLDAIDHALAFQPNDRPQSLAQWAHELPQAPGEPATDSDTKIRTAIADDASTVAAPPMPHRCASPPDTALRPTPPNNGVGGSKGWLRLAVLLLGVLLGAGGWYAWRHSAIGPGGEPMATPQPSDTPPLTGTPQPDSTTDGSAAIDSNDPDTSESSQLAQDDNTAEGGNAIVFNTPTPRPASSNEASEGNNEGAQTTASALTETTETPDAGHEPSQSSGANSANDARSQPTDPTRAATEGSQSADNSTLADEGAPDSDVINGGRDRAQTPDATHIANERSQPSDAPASTDARSQSAEASRLAADSGRSTDATPMVSEPSRADDTTTTVAADSQSSDRSTTTRDRSQTTDATTVEDTRSQATDASNESAQATDTTSAANARSQIADSTRSTNAGAQNTDATSNTTSRSQPTQTTNTASTAGATETTDRIADLLASADRDIAQLRLTSPPGNNAFEKLSDVQRLDAQNEAAKIRLERIVVRYFGLVDRAAARGDYDAARGYLDRAEGVLPNHPELPGKRTQLQQAQQQALALAATPPPTTPPVSPAPKPATAERMPSTAPALASAPSTTPAPASTPPVVAAPPAGLRIGIYPNETIVPCYHSVGGRVTDRAKGIAAQRDDVDVAFDYYRASGAINTVGRPDQVWTDSAVNKRPRVSVVTRSARRLELDAVLMGWYDCSESQHLTDDTYSLDLFLVDVSTGQIYEAKVPLLQSSQAVSSLMTQLLKARGRQ